MPRMKQAHSTSTARLKEQMMKSYHQKSVKYQLLALIISGLLPPNSCLNSRWKSVLYDSYTVMSFMIHIPFCILQILGIYAYWGNVPVVAGIIFQITVCFDGLVILIYFTYHRKYLVHIFEMLGTEFLPYIRRVGLYQKQDKIMEESTKYLNRLAKTFAITFVFAMSAWCVFPFFVKLWSHDPDKELASNTTGRLHFEYFVIATWIPDNAFTSPTYEIIYACQFFYIWSTVTNFTVGNMAFSYIFYSIATQFHLLSGAIEDIDYICVDLDANLMNQENNSLTGKIFNSNVADTVIHGDETPGEPKPKNSSTDRFSSNPIKNVDIFGTPCGDVTDSTDWPALYENSSKSTETMYMIECIQYHQRILNFCTEVDNFLSPVLLIYILIYELMICVPLFQLVLGDSDHKYRFLTSLVDASFLPLTICLSGEILSRESLAVRTAAYGCQWYNRSHNLKKLLQIVIMRTMEPVKMTAGRFFVISLETYADIGNKVFAYFTLLKNMQD